MAIEDQLRWDCKHAASRIVQPPSALLRDILDDDHWRLSGGKALDLACGSGRNALLLAQRDFAVTAIDISRQALEQGREQATQGPLQIVWQQADLECVRLPEQEYDFIVNINYLQRSLVPQIRGALKDGGHVVFETYSIEQMSVGHPHNPAYLLQHNELLDWFRDFRVLLYREGKFADAETSSFRAGLFAQKIP